MRENLVQGCCGLVDPGMSDGDAAVVAERFRALADPTRVRIMNLLIRNPELCVCDMNANFELSQPTISHHLALLRKAGLVEMTARGRWSMYRADQEAIRELANILEVSE
jgi:ArsR family transcriptional regulator, arsenate/arsenite/antimonite-responsive transcriptional repressor